MSSNHFMGTDGFVWFVGVVEDRNDPSELGRVRVRCVGFHTEDKTRIPTEGLPWAHVMHPVTDPSMSGMGHTPSFLVEGSWVVVDVLICNCTYLHLSILCSTYLYKRHIW